MEAAYQRRGSRGVPSLHRRFRGSAHPVPIFPYRFHDGGQHQPFHEGARGKLGAQPAPLLGGQGVFQQRAEDGRFYVRPVLAGGQDQ